MAVNLEGVPSINHEEVPMLNLKMRLATKLESSALPDKLQLTFDEPNTVSGPQIVVTVPYEDAVAMRTGRYYRLTATEEGA
ncbi:hypothetical protein, partial [Stenotrophomonas maltophilia]